jgi:hypothetical protein
VISSIVIQGLRGVSHGRIDGLGPISILVGPNNSGKSTCLEAIAMLASGGHAGTAVENLLRRGGPPGDAVAHIVSHGATAARVEGVLDDASVHTCELSLGRLRDREAVRMAHEEGLAEPMTPVATEFRLGLKGGSTVTKSSTFVDPAGKVAIATRKGADAESPFSCALVDVQAARSVGALEDAYTSIDHAGRLKEVVLALATSMPSLTDLRIQKAGEHFILHAMLSDGPPVPVYLIGDGSKRFIELAAAIVAVDPGGVVLLEEPECYQHPRYVRELAALLVASAKAGRQTILSTHSIELVDVLLGAAEGLPYPFIHRLRLVGGTLSSVALTREQARVSRHDLLEDLRA